MKISKKDALLWFSFFCTVGRGGRTAAEADGTGLRSTFAQIEDALRREMKS